MQVLDRINNKIGAFVGIDEVPPAGARSYVITADMPAVEVTDATNWSDIVIEAAFDPRGLDFRAVARLLSPWQGGPGKQAPTLTYTFPVSAVTGVVVSPTRVRAVLVNGVRGTGSPAVCGLISAFA